MGQRFALGRSQMTATPEATVPAVSADDAPPAKKQKTGPRTAVGVKKVKGDPPRKRGPPRPHRKLSQDILETRISKLRKRIERARGQLEDAERHIDGYDKEAKYREQEAKSKE